MTELTLTDDERAILGLLQEIDWTMGKENMYKILKGRKISQALRGLCKAGLVATPDTGFKGLRYEITDKGRKLLRQETTNEDPDGGINRVEILETALRETTDMLYDYARNVVVVGAKSPKQQIEENRRLLEHE